MNKVTPWQERFTDGMAVSFNDQLKAMQAEIDELRAALAAQPARKKPRKQDIYLTQKQEEMIAANEMDDPRTNGIGTPPSDETQTR